MRYAKSSSDIKLRKFSKSKLTASTLSQPHNNKIGQVRVSTQQIQIKIGRYFETVAEKLLPK